MNTKIVRKESINTIQTEWGALAWLVSGKEGTSNAMTFGRVTIKPGQANPVHHHPNCEEILYVLEGQIEHSLPEGGEVVLHAGDCIILQEGGKHQARNIGSQEAVVVVAFNSADRQTIGED